MQPDGIDYGVRNDAPRVRAWAAHYEAKGAHPETARRVAMRKVRACITWPPMPVFLGLDVGHRPAITVRRPN